MHRVLAVLIALTGCAPVSGPRGDWPAECPHPGREGIEYLHDTWEDRGVCAAADFACEDGELYIAWGTDEDCGCGCMTVVACRRDPSCEVPEDLE